LRSSNDSTSGRSFSTRSSFVARTIGTFTPNASSVYNGRQDGYPAPAGESFRAKNIHLLPQWYSSPRYWGPWTRPDQTMAPAVDMERWRSQLRARNAVFNPECGYNRQDDQETEEKRGAGRVTAGEPRVCQHLHVGKPWSLPREEGLHLSVNVAAQIHRDPKHGQVMPPPEQDHAKRYRPGELSYQVRTQVCPDLKDQTVVATSVVKSLADRPIHFRNDSVIAHVGCQEKEKSRTDTPEKQDLFRDDGQN
jgi:hypothetical protein